MLKGIDVSKHQGKIDWQKVAKAGIDFVMIRAGYGKYKAQEDNQFKANITGAFSAGLPIGIYWYSYATSSADAAEEAKVCLSIIEPYKDKIRLPVFFDQEYEQGIKAASKEVRTACCNTFISAIQKAGYESGLYCSYDWITNMVDEVKGYKWIAQYASQCRYSRSKLWAWQYSSSGTVDGISGRVDLDAGYFEITQPKDGWSKTSNAWYYYESGKAVKSAWRQIKGTNGTHWYYFGSTGQMLTGFQAINSKLYFLNPSAAEGIPEGALIITDSKGNIVK